MPKGKKERPSQLDRCQTAATPVAEPPHAKEASPWPIPSPTSIMANHASSSEGCQQLRTHEPALEMGENGICSDQHLSTTADVEAGGQHDFQSPEPAWLRKAEEAVPHAASGSVEEVDIPGWLSPTAAEEEDAEAAAKAQEEEEEEEEAEAAAVLRSSVASSSTSDGQAQQQERQRREAPTSPDRPGWLDEAEDALDALSPPTPPPPLLAQFADEEEEPEWLGEASATLERLTSPESQARSRAAAWSIMEAPSSAADAFVPASSSSCRQTAAEVIAVAAAAAAEAAEAAEAAADREGRSSFAALLAPAATTRMTGASNGQRAQPVPTRVPLQQPSQQPSLQPQPISRVASLAAAEVAAAAATAALLERVQHAEDRLGAEMARTAAARARIEELETHVAAAEAAREKSAEAAKRLLSTALTERNALRSELTAAKEAMTEREAQVRSVRAELQSLESLERRQEKDACGRAAGGVASKLILEKRTRELEEARAAAAERSVEHSREVDALRAVAEGLNERVESLLRHEASREEETRRMAEVREAERVAEWEAVRASERAVEGAMERAAAAQAEAEREAERAGMHLAHSAILTAIQAVASEEQRELRLSLQRQEAEAAGREAAEMERREEFERCAAEHAAESRARIASLEAQLAQLVAARSREGTDASAIRIRAIARRESGYVDSRGASSSSLSSLMADEGNADEGNADEGNVDEGSAAAEATEAAQASMPIPTSRPSRPSAAVAMAVTSASSTSIARSGSSFLVSTPEIRPRWKPDHDAPACEAPSCGASFSWINRRHHCRACGGVFCDECSSSRVRLPTHMGYGQQKQRVCDLCGVEAMQARAHPGMLWERDRGEAPRLTLEY